MKVESRRLVRSHCVVLVRDEGGLDQGTAVERKRSGKEEECGNFLEVELTGLADEPNLGVKGKREPRMPLWFGA